MLGDALATQVLPLLVQRGVILDELRVLVQCLVQGRHAEAATRGQLARELDAGQIQVQQLRGLFFCALRGTFAFPTFSGDSTFRLRQNKVVRHVCEAQLAFLEQLTVSFELDLVPRQRDA